jgi:hypothetical protein
LGITKHGEWGVTSIRIYQAGNSHEVVQMVMRMDHAGAGTTGSFSIPVHEIHCDDEN